MSDTRDPWEELQAQLEALDLEPTDASDIVNVSTLADEDLIVRLQETVDELFRRKEALAPKTQTGRDLHSVRTALLVEMARRRLR